MKKQKWLLLAPATLALAAGCMLLSTNDTTKANAAGSSFYTAAQIGISGDASDYATLVSGATADDFTMEKGASVRTSVNGDGKLGIRFKTNVAKAGEGKYYTELTLGLETPITVYVECSPEEDGEYYASLLYSNLTETEKAAYKALEVTARGVYVNDTGYAYTKAEDNVRTMEGVANAAILADAPKEDVAEYVTSFTKAEKVYGEQAAGLSVSYNGTASAVYMNAKKLASTDLSAISLAAEEVGSEGWVSVVDANGNFTNYPYLCATKVIRQASDLANVYDSAAASTIDGYFAVANDISYDSTFIPTPYLSKWNPALQNDKTSASRFIGTFDGQGHTIEYGVKAGGLFGWIADGAIIKDAAFVVKNIFPGAEGFRQPYQILASTMFADNAADYIQLENVYAGYDIENFTPSLTYSSYSTGLGLASCFYRTDLKNVVVDFSKVQGADAVYEEGASASFGVVGTRNTNTSYWYVHPTAGTICFTDMVVIWDVPCMGYIKKDDGTVVNARFAENDTAEKESFIVKENLGTPAESLVTTLVGVKRFDNYAETKAYYDANPELLKAFKDITDISMGFPFVGDKEACIENNTVVTVDGTTATETAFDVATSASKTLSLNFLGADVENVTVAHDSGVEVVAMEGTTITYTAGVVGQETLKVTATVNGVAVEKVLTVNVIVPDMGTIYFDTDATLPAALKDVTITKVTNAANAEEEYFDGTTWNVAANTSNAIVEHDALVYGESGLLGSAKIVVATKVIETEKDLESLYGGSSSAPVKGYYLVVNDIVDDPAFTPAPAQGSYFAGIFDGNGKKIEYSVKANGLLGTITANAQVKNVSLIVKGVPTTAVTAAYSILAYEVEINSTNVLLENIYATYDIENFTPDVSFNSWGTTSGVGLLEYARSGRTGVTLKNVIVDLSKVIIADPTNETSNFTHGYGAIAARGQTFNGSDSYWTYQNVHVIFDNPYVNFKRDVKTPEYSILQAVAQYTLGIGESSTLTAVNVMKPSGLKHYNNYAAVTETVKVGSFVISSEGVSKA